MLLGARSAFKLACNIFVRCNKCWFSFHFFRFLIPQSALQQAGWQNPLLQLFFSNILLWAINSNFTFLKKLKKNFEENQILTNKLKFFSTCDIVILNFLFILFFNICLKSNHFLIHNRIEGCWYDAMWCDVMMYLYKNWS